MASHVTDRKIPEIIFPYVFLHTFHTSRPELSWHPPSLYTMDTESFPGVRRPGHCVNHPVSSAEVKERVELYLYSPSGPS